MSSKLPKSTPEPTIRRLPEYIHLLRRLGLEGLKNISSTTIANELNLDSTQVRKDIEYTGIVGKPKTGYDLIELEKAIESFLNWNNTNDAFLVGAGNLGTAMLGYKQFMSYGLDIVAAFDTNPEIVGKSIYNVPVLEIDKLQDLAQRMHILIGVITVPAPQAQSVASLMVEAGMKAIWNFAPTSLKVPQDVIVENASLSVSLSALKRKLVESLFIQETLH